MNIENIKKYWCYKDIAKNYKITIKETKKGANVSINYLSGVKFKIERYNLEIGDQTIDTFRVLDEHNNNIINDLEFTDNLEELICGVLYYFNTRY